MRSRRPNSGTCGIASGLALAALFGACAAPPLPCTDKVLPLPGEAFALAGRDAFLLLPRVRAHEGPLPWVLYAPTLPGLPSAAEQWLFERLLASGVASPASTWVSPTAMPPAARSTTHCTAT